MNENYKNYPQKYQRLLVAICQRVGGIWPHCIEYAIN